MHGWDLVVDWDEPDWMLLRTRVDHLLLESVADTPGLTMLEMNGSWHNRSGRWRLDVPPRPQANLTALSVAAEGWIKLNNHPGLHRRLAEQWGDDEPLVDLIREEGRAAEDVIRSRLEQEIDSPFSTIGSTFSQRFWSPAAVEGQDRIFPTTLTSVWFGPDWYSLETVPLARALGVSEGRADELIGGDSMLRWEEFLMDVLINVLQELVRRSPAGVDCNAWLMTKTSAGRVVADDIAVWDWDSLLTVANYLPSPRP